ncbi:putative Mg2+ transporter-C (MgtC) family protein [Brockia lithotrophica]|uniref:Putative Mg2+ transporter-C (MgtC) family protein n=1 Tax=Brockia lithotrophica TaxID=933949 RepID=A0A660L5U5_9BACL|nr:putative Mg2+ transporter-C (MgtC) family protein [Brockia lithotrophica]
MNLFPALAASERPCSSVLGFTIRSKKPLGFALPKLRQTDMLGTVIAVTLGEFALRIGTAVLLGAMIGFERQWRQRRAGLRTNALVALASATFVSLSELVPGDTSPTRIASYVVSGIGFLGAGVIMREGFNVRGLNTAATLWASAAVGVLAGWGFTSYAALAAAFVVLTHVVLRPLGAYIDRRPLGEATDLDVAFVLTVVCRAKEEYRLRLRIIEELARERLRLLSLQTMPYVAGGSPGAEPSPPLASPDELVVIEAEIRHANEEDRRAMEGVAERIAADPDVRRVRWYAREHARED